MWRTFRMSEWGDSWVSKLAFLIIVALCAGIFVVYVWIGRREVSLINPEIYPAFKRIELEAMLYTKRKLVNVEEYKRCKAVVDGMIRRYRDEASVEECYKFLSSLGFPLPPLKLKEPASEAQKEKCMIEAKRLFEIQTKILEEQLRETIREAEEMIKTEKIE